VFCERAVEETDDAHWHYSFYEERVPAMQQPMAMAEARPVMAPPPMQPMPAPMVQQMPMQGMQQMAASQLMASYAPNPSPGAMLVPFPVPMPYQMPFSMPKPADPQSVPVPPGFKLVRIPEKVPVPEKKPAPTKSAISDPAITEHKIFVGGLNPVTTGQALREYFAEFGPVLDAKVIREGERSKGFGFVQFKDSIPAEVLERTHIIDQRRCGVGPAFHDGAR
jgi:hypothetical protein